VALKLLPSDLTRDPLRVQRFEQEARAASALNHPNVCTIHALGQTSDGQHYIAMEYVEGETLRHRLATGRLSIREAVEMAIQVAAALSAAHAAGIVHRDIKPENLMLRRDGFVKVLDFGLAKLAPAAPEIGEADTARTVLKTEAGMVVGTTAYMAPEQARGDALDARSDTFSFGTVLYEIVTGRAPFQGRTSADVLSSIIRDQPVPPAEINPAVPQELQRIIAQCLEKDPRDRYQHTDQLAVDLRKLNRSTDSDASAPRTLSGVDSAAPRTNWLGRLGGPRRRRVLIGAVACLLLAAGFGAWQWFRPEPSFDNREGIIVGDFENRTGRAEFDTALRDTFEQLLSSSTYLKVIRGDRLKSLVGVRPQDPLPTLDNRTVDRLCAGGKCAFIVGRIEPEGGSFRLQVDLFRVGGKTPIFTRSKAVRAEPDSVMALHDVAIDLRRTLGEAPGAIALTSTPTTRSLAAFQAYAAGRIEEESDRPDTAVALYRRALAIDPEFVDTYTAIAVQYQNLGNWNAARQNAEQAYRRSSRLPQRSRFLAEIVYLDVQYDFDAEIDRLKSHRRLYPYDDEAANFLGWLYLFVREDPVAAEPHLRAAYEIRPNSVDLDMLTNSLLAQSKSDEIAQVAEDYRRRTGEEPAVAILKTLASRSDWKAMLQTADRYARDGTLSRGQAAWYRGLAYMRTGRLREAQALLEIDKRETIKADGIPGGSTLLLAWLGVRLSGRRAVLSDEDLAGIEPSGLRWWAVFTVEADVPEPLATLVATFQEMERGSHSRFVREELQFARGCLAFARRDLMTARRLIEPLAANTEMPHRHQALGRLYEAQGMWPEAAAQYEAVLRNPNLIALFWPALWNLDRFRLAQAYERLGDSSRARQLYELFTADWKDGDRDIPELATARQRLAVLSKP
jgi:eukaryotic-like serine/threonine-protein kinase